MNKKVFLALALFSAVICSAQQKPQEPVKGKVNVDILNMRSGAGIDHPVVGKISKESEISILKQNGNWLEITAPASLKLYISEARVNPDGTLNGELNIRSAMSTEAPILGVLPKGAKVERIDERRNGWVRIVPPESVKVYVSAFCVDFDRNAFNSQVETVKAPVSDKGAEDKRPAPDAAEKTAVLIPAVKAEAVTLKGVITAWQHSRQPETAFALLDAPNGRNLGFITSADPAKLAANDGKKVTVSGKITGRTDAGAMIIAADEIVPEREK